MAIAYRASGTRTKADVSLSGSPQSFAMPVGHVANDWLLWTIVTDDNSGPASTPSGWTSIGGFAPGSSVLSPYTGRPHVWLFARFDDGSLGGSASCAFSRTSWPSGNPYVLGWISAWSGVDPTGAIELILGNSTTSTANAHAHPTATTVVPNDWLISIRAVVGDQQSTFTNSVGTDVERVDDAMTNPSSPSAALYDSNAALTAGAQTQRTTTSSNLATYGSVAVTIAIKPAPAANAVFASAGVAEGVGTAPDANTSSVNGPWDPCAVNGLPLYDFAIDWNGDGSFNSASSMLTLALMGTGGADDATDDIISDVTITYGRDQERQLAPAAVGSAAFSVINVSRKYSPEWATSVLYGDLEPARAMRGQVQWGGGTFPLFTGRIDDFNVKADRADRSVDFTFLDAMNDLSQIKISTSVYTSLRTGDLINVILDAVGWTAGRDIDLGATIVKYWWVDGTDALSAINDLVKSEGPPAIAYVAPDGTFVFHDRHHRIQNAASTSVQATYADKAFYDCTAPTPVGYHFTAPFTYQHGWRDIVNSIDFDVTERAADADVTVVWSTDDTIVLTNGQSTTLEISTNDPFMDAITPVLGTDYTVTGAGTVTVSLSRDSGQSTRLTFTAIGGSASVRDVQVRAVNIPVLRNLRVHRDDPGSISKHGERAYPDQAPWANANDAYAIAGVILLRYAQRRPTVQLRVVTQDPTHFLQIVSRTIGDRIHIYNGEMGINDDFFVERVTHTIQRINAPGRAPVHAVVFGCEKAFVQATNPFRFDVRGAGFDQGIFDPISADSPSTTFVFDSPVSGMFDVGQYGS